MTSIRITIRAAAAVVLILSVLLVGAHQAAAASGTVLDAKVDDAIVRFYTEVGGAEELSKKAAGMLVFPSVIKAGIGVGGEYGEGALRVGGKTVAYYNTAAASIGFQLGAQAKTVILLFMTKDALKGFRASNGWEVGVDGSVALVKVGAGGAIDTTTVNAPIAGFVFGNKGLMYNLTLEGSKMTRIEK